MTWVGGILRLLIELVADLRPIGVVLLGWAGAHVLGAGAFAGPIGTAAGGLYIAFRYVRGLGGRRECERQIAQAVLSILDRRLDLTRIDGVGFGDFLTLRLLASAARAGHTRSVVSFGGPAMTLARVVGDLITEFEDESARCYVRLRSGEQRRVDAFAAALRRIRSAADAMLNPPAYDPADPQAASTRFIGDLAAAILEVERAGDDLHRAFDAPGFDAAVSARQQSTAELLRRQNHAAAVLYKSAEAAFQALQAYAVTWPLSANDLPALIERIRNARQWVLDVEAPAFREATDDARAAHRHVTYTDLPEALDAAARLERDIGDERAQHDLRARLDHIPVDIAALDAMRQRREPVLLEGTR